MGHETNRFDSSGSSRNDKVTKSDFEQRAGQ